MAFRRHTVGRFPGHAIRLTAAALLLSTASWGQNMLRPSLQDGSIRIINSDRAVLSSPERRKDVPCSVFPSKPKLGFDLQFTAGYMATVPLRALAGSGNSLRILFRVKPLDGKGERHYFWDRYSVPALTPDAVGEATIPGRFKLGAGRYQVDWLMRDQSERVCSAQWEIECSVPGLIEGRGGTRQPFTVGPNEVELFLEEPPVRRAKADGLLHVKLLVNFTPTDASKVKLRPYDLQNIVSIVRAISREPRIGSFSFVGFNMQEERVILEQQNVRRVDFPALGEAVASIEGGIIDFAQLQDEESEHRFLTELFTRHLGPQEPEPDAVVIIGPKLMLEKKVSHQVLARNPQVRAPVFYLIYNTDPYVYPWRDAISSALKFYRGLEYTISLPKDFGRAMKDMMARIAGKTEPSVNTLVETGVSTQ